MSGKRASGKRVIGKGVIGERVGSERIRSCVRGCGQIFKRGYLTRFFYTCDNVVFISAYKAQSEKIWRGILRRILCLTLCGIL